MSGGLETIIGTNPNQTSGLFLILCLVLVLIYVLPVTIFGFLLPLWTIHKKMVQQGETNEEGYAASIEALRKQTQELLDTNQLEAAKTTKDKMDLMQALHAAYPTWPFYVRSKFFPVLAGAGTSLLLGVLTALHPLLFQAIQQSLTSQH